MLFSCCLSFSFSSIQDFLYLLSYISILFKGDKKSLFLYVKLFLFSYICIISFASSTLLSIPNNKLKAEVDRLIFSLSFQDGQAIECGCCYIESSFDDMVQCSDVCFFQLFAVWGFKVTMLT